MEDTFTFYSLSLSLLSLSLISLITNTASADTCTPSSCLPTTGSSPQVRFPFLLYPLQLSDRQPARCGFPGFNLLCNARNQTILNLPSGQVIVKRISYSEQTVTIDPQFCLPNRINDFSLEDTPFLNFFLYSYTFFNCSSEFGAPRFTAVSPVVFDCLSGANYSVVAMPTYYAGQDMMPASCRNISTIDIPLRRYQALSEQELELRWFMPECSSCEFDGGTCGTSSYDAMDVICYRGHTRGLSRGARYGITFGLAVPAMLCVIALLYCTKRKVQAQNQRSQHRGIDINSITLTPRPNILMGLDGATIESYPKTVIGESRRLPKPNDGTCAICLSDYKPKDELRTIPECNHYFHADCLDEWLRMNATCPLCRNTPETSAVTPCTTMTTTTTTTSSALTSSNATTSPTTSSNATTSP